MKGTSYTNALLQLLFQQVAATAIGGLLANAASPDTQLWVALHTSDPTASGSQNTNESAYTGYARVAVARTTGGWTVTGESVSPAANIVFPACTGAAGTQCTNWSVGTAQTGVGEILYTGTITGGITPAVGAAPTLTNASTITES